MLVGVTLIRNGVKLAYPFVPCIENLLVCCDKVYVNIDTQSEDQTVAVVENLCSKWGDRLAPVYTEWDLGETAAEDHGLRINQCLDRAMEEGGESVLYCQADEVVFPGEIKTLLENVSPARQNVYLQRTYYWQNLDYINLDWNIDLLRLCPLTPNVRAVEGAMTLSKDDRFPEVYVPERAARIFHYSRVGETRDIANRLNSLRKLFKNDVDQLEDFSFEENYEFQPEVQEENIVRSYYKHPPGIKEFYGV